MATGMLTRTTARAAGQREENFEETRKVAIKKTTTATNLSPLSRNNRALVEKAHLPVAQKKAPGGIFGAQGSCQDVADRTATVPACGR